MNLRFSLQRLANDQIQDSLFCAWDYIKLGINLEFYGCLQKTLSNEILIAVHVTPNASQSCLLGYDQWTKNLKIAVRAKAEGGRANNAVLHVMAELLGVPKNDIGIVAGQKSRTKKIMISGHDIQLIKKALSRSLGW